MATMWLGKGRESEAEGAVGFCSSRVGGRGSCSVFGV